MILSDREVRAAIQRNVIWVTPSPPANDKRWSATTLDLTLDAEIRRACGDKGQENSNDSEYTDNYLFDHSCC